MMLLGKGPGGSPYSRRRSGRDFEGLPEKIHIQRVWLSLGIRFQETLVSLKFYKTRDCTHTNYGVYLKLVIVWI